MIENVCPVEGSFKAYSIVLIETIVDWLILEKFLVCLWVNLDSTKAVETVSKAFKYMSCGEN
jgi:hypothetical protein